MVDPRAGRRLLFRALFAGLSALVIFAQILPLDTGADHLPSPDILILICMAWVLRRPDYVPTLLLAAVLLAADILFMRPLGLAAAIGLLGVEALRGRGPGGGDLTFAGEWALVAALLAAITLAEMVALGVLLVTQPPIGATVLQYALTVAAYPVVAFASTRGFGVRAATPGERDAMGMRA